jgi:membrane-bound lytic murein transglycosylase B
VRRRATAASAATALVAVLALALPAGAGPRQATPPTTPAGAVDPTQSAVPTPTELATIAPIDTPGIDPVLDGVAVEETAAIRRADEAVAAAAAAQNQATLRWVDAERTRTDLAGKAGTAGQAAADAETARQRAVADQAVKEQRLAERRKVEAAYRAVLADRQGELRSLAAKLYATAPEARYAVLGSLDDVTEASRRDALRDRGSSLQVDRVTAAHRPWAKAHEARLRTQRQLARARTTTATATEQAAARADERDRYDELVAAASDRVRTAVSDLERVRGDVDDALAARRTARLERSVDGLNLPLVALDAYWRASALAPCSIPWWVIAGIGRVESGHGSAHGSSLTPTGDTKVHILGIPLDGRPGVMAIADTDGGRLDDDPVWDRAVGPMQFLPGTWGRWAADGNADAKADPHNIYDAAGAAARYLCFSRGDLTTEAQIRTALLAYNRSVPYGTKVLAEGGRYRDALDLPDVPATRTASTAPTDPTGDTGN